MNVTDQITISASLLTEEFNEDTGEIVKVSDSKRVRRIVAYTSETLSYFRKGRLTKDVFNKFRNFYLVAENI